MSKRPIFIKKSPLKIDDVLSSKKLVVSKEPVVENLSRAISENLSLESQIDDILNYIFDFLLIKDVLDTVVAIISSLKRFKEKRNIVGIFRQRVIKILFRKYHDWDPKGILRFPSSKDKRMNIASISNLNTLMQLQEILNRVIPSRIKVIKFGEDFKEPFRIKWFPEIINLQSLEFDKILYRSRSSQVLNPGDLPQSLKVLAMSSFFNRPILENILPECLEELHFGVEFNQPLDRYSVSILPKSLKILKLDGFFNQPLDTHGISVYRIV